MRGIGYCSGERGLRDTELIGDSCRRDRSFPCHESQLHSSNLDTACRGNGGGDLGGRDPVGGQLGSVGGQINHNPFKYYRQLLCLSRPGTGCIPTLRITSQQCTYTLPVLLSSLVGPVEQNCVQTRFQLLVGEGAHRNDCHRTGGSPVHIHTGAGLGVQHIPGCIGHRCIYDTDCIGWALDAGQVCGRLTIGVSRNGRLAQRAECPVRVARIHGPEGHCYILHPFTFIRDNRHGECQL